jgi:hypothetical protein
MTAMTATLGGESVLGAAIYSHLDVRRKTLDLFFLFYPLTDSHIDIPSIHEIDVPLLFPYSYGPLPVRSQL